MNNSLSAEAPNTLRSDAGSRISSMKFSTQDYARYIKIEQDKKRAAKTELKRLVHKIIDKKNWRQRWSKIKTFIQHNRQVLQQQMSRGAGGQHDRYLSDEKN